MPEKEYKYPYNKELGEHCTERLRNKVNILTTTIQLLFKKKCEDVVIDHTVGVLEDINLIIEDLETDLKLCQENESI